MARHVYSYRSRFDEFSFSTDGRRESHNVSTVVPVASPLPIAVASSNYQHVYHVQPQPYPHTYQQPHSRYSTPSYQAQSYQDDYHGNSIPIAIAIPV